MSLKFKKSYRFAVKSSLYISLFAAGSLGFLMYFLNVFSWIALLLFTASVAIFSFFILQFRVERFIYRRVKKIYDDVSFLDTNNFSSQPITTDMATLTREVKKFATDKKLEIEGLRVREDYRREFLGNVSHELKTPLFTVQGYLSTLLDGALNDKSVRKKYLERAEKGVERLIYIVNDLDMIAKLEMGDLVLEKQKFDIVKLVQNVFDLLEIESSKKDILLLFDQRYSKPVYVWGDSEKIEQVLINLVMNSIKYGKDKGSTEVSIEELTEKKIIVRINDDGEGIDQQYIPRLFERFFRVDKSGSRDAGGSGLGLSIVKHLIEAHDEKIFVKSRLGHGSEFSFTLEKAE
ncbi:sensor histidine kinase [Flavobacterium silvaticum]|uniref:histidine kinase n=1 Tax=Flavobacterium silvaticum TaxID=1852020 RepID=A0A972JGT7_9FLAO|nr:ATP-binding protein [Flavobacterium silvaticum]NMH28541.1 sensor histidine kinase [Flavobacterium silvaticum]